MAFLQGLFGRTAPARVESDLVIPLGFLDDTPLMKRIVLYNLHVYDEVLDPLKLHEALERLARRDAWGKLGARIRSNAAGGLDYHVPQKFSKDRPAIAFTHLMHPMKKADHPLASKLPKPTQNNRPTIVADPDEFLPLAKGDNCPGNVDDYIYSDRPAFGLHIVSFQDATLVTLHWLHLGSDTMGNKALVENWVKCLEGRDNEVEMQAGFLEDPCASLGLKPTEPHVLEKHRMTTGQMAGWAFNNIADLAIRAKENRMISIPAGYVDELRRVALAELEAARKPGDPKPFLTDNDILTAWLSRLAVSHLPPTSNRPVTLQVTGSMRKALEVDLLPKGRPYVANCFGFFNALTTAGDILTKPLSATAAAVRAAVNAQRSRAQLEAYYAMFREQSVLMPIFFGNSATHQLSFSNWTQSDLFSLTDLSAARVHKRSGPCLPSYINHSQMPFQFGEGFLFVGKDNGGNYWMCGYRSKGMWAKVQEAIDAGL